MHSVEMPNVFGGKGGCPGGGGVDDEATGAGDAPTCIIATDGWLDECNNAARQKYLALVSYTLS